MPCSIPVQYPNRKNMVYFVNFGAQKECNIIILNKNTYGSNNHEAH